MYWNFWILFNGIKIADEILATNVRIIKLMMEVHDKECIIII
jgi:hypothetical protein